MTIFPLRQRSRHRLTEIDGFISVERFQSIAEPGKLLSLSFFRDEEAVQAWRNQTPHRQAQSKGRREISWITGCASAQSCATTA